MVAENSILIDLYKKQIRSTLEYACPVWAPGLTQSDTKELKRVQKSAFAIIFGCQDYKHTLQKHNLKTLEERRDQALTKFAVKTSKHQVFSNWFQAKQTKIQTRNKSKYNEVPFRTMQWRNSPIPTMTRILNNR